MTKKTYTTKPHKYIIQAMKYFAILILVAITTFASAQTFDPVDTGFIGQQISGTVTPENPTPGQSVTISLSAAGTNLTTASISWSVNGARVQSGTGMTQFTLTAGRNGEAKRVVATISPSNGPVVTRTFTVAAQDVAIIYESDGYVPPFYKGKGFYTKEGTVTLVALPNLVTAGGVRLNPNNLIYTWSVDNTVQGSKSGYGKNSFVYTGTILARDVLIQVEVSSGDKATKGKAVALLSPLDPEVLLYESSPLYGALFNRELGSNGFSLNGKEVTLSAVPFSTSATSPNDSNLSYFWSINGSTIPVPKTQSYATFRNTTGQQGNSLVGISVSNTTHLLQMMRKTLSINF
jgi:hypothetical protein